MSLPDYMIRAPRTLAQIALTPAERRAICERMRADRLARGGAVVADPQAVERSVRASQYLAGVVLSEDA